ncbi:hypothetical protein QQ054_06785 [Oscillatoria amoena NRMC-F 0135]|nr:hypothetical protein [Oscillatoria amoena NRMC-F 0135]
MNTRNMKVIGLMTALAMAGCSANQRKPALDVEAYKEEIRLWQQKRNAYQVSENGWVNIAGLFWLKEGINSFGSGTDNDLVFPEGKIPEHAGYLLMQHDIVTLHGAQGVEFIINGTKTSSARVYHPDSSLVIMEHGSLRWFCIEREGKIGVRLRDLEHPHLKEFSGIDFFDIDPDWRIEGRVAWLTHRVQ